MTFADFVNSTNLTGNSASLLRVVASMALSLVLSMVVFWVYKRTYQGVMYSKSFNVSLIALAMITTAVILAVTSNIILSLGMVGALSIVRFRTAIKDPMDIVYMFWAITVGIISGAGLYLIAVVTCAIVAGVLLAYSRINIKMVPYLMIVSYSDPDVEDEIFKVLGEATGRYKIKSKVRRPDGIEMTIEINSRKADMKIVDQINQLVSVSDTAMMSYDGEYAL